MILVIEDREGNLRPDPRELSIDRANSLIPSLNTILSSSERLSEEPSWFSLISFSVSITEDKVVIAIPAFSY